MEICIIYFTCFINFMHIVKAKKVHRLEDYISPNDLTIFSNLDPGWEKMMSNLHNWENEQITDTSKPKPKLRGVDITCFGASLLSYILPLIFSTDTVPKSSFAFCSRKKCTTSQHSLKNLNISSYDFSPDRSMVILVHGFMSHGDALWVQEMKLAFLAWANVNIIVVNWNDDGGSVWMYWKAVENARHVGSHIATLVKYLVKKTHVKITQFHCVGHSLGAHVCAHASTEAGLFGRITGLDPAQPCFETDDLSKRLDSSDARYVDVIHTNGRLYRKLDFGFTDRLGTADFYPNGGHIQPGCIDKEEGSSWAHQVTAVQAALEEAVCSHGMAYKYFTNSLVYANESSACSFRAVPWKVGKHEPRRNDCGAKVCPEMGINAIGSPEHVRAKGSYFVDIQDDEPYCISVSSKKHKDRLVGACPVHRSRLTLLFVLFVYYVGIWFIS